MSNVNTNLYSATGGAEVNLAADSSYTTTRQIRATGSGVVKVDFLDGQTDVDIPIGAYGTAEVQVTKIYSTANGTTCTGVVVLF